MNPYLVLQVSRDANDATIRRAYLEAIRVSPPETEPIRFKEVTAAYEKIKDASKRAHYKLFDLECLDTSPAAALVRHARYCAPPPPLPFESFKKLLQTAAKS